MKRKQKKSISTQMFSRSWNLIEVSFCLDQIGIFLWYWNAHFADRKLSHLNSKVHGERMVWALMQVCFAALCSKCVIYYVINLTTMFSISCKN